jgi:hypothetical protein
MGVNRPNLADRQGVSRRGDTTMFLRFVTRSQDETSHRLEGVFNAAYRLRDHGRLGKDEARQVEVLFRWFNLHLPIPDRFCLVKGKQAHRQAICWFKAAAAGYVGKVRELVVLLERNGVPIRMLRTRRPGYVVYEDAFQVAAVPFRDTLA